MLARGRRLLARYATLPSLSFLFGQLASRPRLTSTSHLPPDPSPPHPQAKQALEESAKREQEALAKAQAAKAELAKVVVKAEDVAYLLAELELPKEKADQMLRAHKGDLAAVLQAYTSGL